MKTMNLVGDFETTSYKNQERADVWSAAFCSVGNHEPAKVTVKGSIKDAWQWLVTRPANEINVYFHNLKFDGSFILDYLIQECGYSQAFEYDENGNIKGFLKVDEMPPKSVRYLISSMGMWYSITVKIAPKRYIVFKDSLKLIPFSLSEIGKAFKTEHQKLEMEYKGFRYPNCEISDDEMNYIKNDVLVLSEALEFMFLEGHKKLTIGSCCLSEYKDTLPKKGVFKYSELFPDLTKFELDPVLYGSANADEYIRKSYKGGWCYLKKGKENKVYKKGYTADVNSLYPSMMHSSSYNFFPVGNPTFCQGEPPKELLLDGLRYYFVRFRCRFDLKPDKLPFIQIKGSALYASNEMLESSEPINPRTKKHYRYYIKNGIRCECKPELTMTKTDFELFQEHYNIHDIEFLDYCYFSVHDDLFDTYLDNYIDIKQHSTGALRTLAKLFLNNLYGKMAASCDSSFKVISFDDNGIMHFQDIRQYDKKPGFIAVGSAITSYSRNFTIRAAQANYNNFIYADTDSIHCEGDISEVQGIKIDDKALSCWKLESYWDNAIFVRQKTYIEHVTHVDGQPVNPFYDIKCAGMTERCKALLSASLTGEKIQPKNEYEAEFLQTQRQLTDFKTGLEVPGKLMIKRLPGGMVLEDGYFTLRPVIGLY